MPLPLAESDMGLMTPICSEESRAAWERCWLGAVLSVPALRLHLVPFREMQDERDAISAADSCDPVGQALMFFMPVIFKAYARTSIDGIIPHLE